MARGLPVAGGALTPFVRPGRARIEGAMADGAMLPADAPAWRRHFHGDGYAYGWLLVLILFSLGFQIGAPDDRLGAGGDDRAPGAHPDRGARGLGRRAAG